MLSRGWARGLVAVLVIDVLLSVVVGLDEIGRFTRIDQFARDLLALCVIGWLLVVLAVTWAALRSTYAVRRTSPTAEGGPSTLPTAREWLWEADTRHRFTYSSDGVRDLLGFEPAQVIGRSALSMVAPECVPRMDKLWRDATAARAGWDAVEWTWHGADGSTIALQGTAAPIFDRKGMVVGYRGSRRRVTDAMTAERAQVAARQRVGEALKMQAVDVALQPVVDLGSGTLAGAEALARFRDGRSPDVWFREARETGQSLALDRLAFTTALGLFDELPQHCYLSVNASPQLLLDHDIQTLLATGGIPLDRLIIEITEHVPIENYDDLHTALMPLRERGVRLAIDDTGAGYASLNHVLQLRPDVIKIDRSLIANLAGDPARRSLVTALVLLALDLEASVTGEGVESPSEFETLASLGVDHAQGYLLGRPTTDRERWIRWMSRNWLEPLLPSTHSAESPTRLPEGDLRHTLR